MGIALVTAYDKACAPLGRLSSANKRDYCLRHGYTFIEYVGDPGEWHAAWLKLPALLMGLTVAETVFWSDADSIIVNPDIRLEDLFDPQATLTITDDTFGLNAGNYFVNALEVSTAADIAESGLFGKTTGDLFLLMMDNWRCRDKRSVHQANLSPWEQRAMQEMYDDGRFSKEGIAVSITDQRKFNSYDPAFYERGTYQEGDFILHYPGQSLAWKRERIVERLAKLSDAPKKCLRNCRQERG